jgi:hypothetical protein
MLLKGSQRLIFEGCTKMLNLNDPAVAIEVVENGFIVGWKEYRDDFNKTGRTTFLKAVAKNTKELQALVVMALKAYEAGKPA